MAEYNAAQLVRDQEAKHSYARAKDFFYARPLAFDNLAALAPTPDSYASDQGTVQFHLIGQKPQDPAYSDIMDQNASNLLGIGGLVHDYMHKTYPNVNSQKLNIDTWANVIDNIPDLAIGKKVNKIYKNSIAGVTVSGQFLSLIAKAMITEGASLLTDFTSFLNSVGDVVFSVHTTDEQYKALTCTYTNYLVDNGAGGYYDYGKITLRQIDFIESFMELKSCCASASYVNVNLSYTEIENVVQTGRIRRGGPDYQAFQDLINANATEQFKNAKNFFNKPATPQSDIKPV